MRDNAAPVLRRGMSFDDVLQGDDVLEGDDVLQGARTNLDGVVCVAATTGQTLPAQVRARHGVVVANLDPTVFAASCPGLATVLIDARMRKYAQQADLRSLAPCTVGIGPGFIAGINVHLAIETLPGHEGGVVTAGPTATPTGKAAPLGGAGAERFVYAPLAGPWLPHVPLGASIEANATIGFLDGEAVVAPIGGRVRGLVRAAPGGVARGSKLVEIDPRPDAPWRGVPPRAARIATGVNSVLAALLPVNRACVTTE